MTKRLILSFIAGFLADDSYCNASVRSPISFFSSQQRVLLLLLSAIHYRAIRHRLIRREIHKGVIVYGAVHHGVIHQAIHHGAIHHGAVHYGTVHHRAVRRGAVCRGAVRHIGCPARTAWARSLFLSWFLIVRILCKVSVERALA